LRLFATPRLALLSITLGCGGCNLSDVARTYAVTTPVGEIIVTCEWFSHDFGYWEPTTEETYQFQCVCDEIPDHGAFGLPPETIVNPNDASEVAQRR
jgi:hypothetical protein